MTVVSDYIPQSPPLAPAPKGIRVERRNIWGFGDQVLISGANFVTMVLAAKALGPSSFGAFTLVYSLMLFANTLQSALITQPHNVLGTTKTGIHYIRFTSSLGIAQLLVAAVVGLIALFAAGISHHFGWHAATPLLAALAPSVVAWQLQEFVRRILYTEGRLFDAFLNDVISYGGQIVAIIPLWWMGILTGPLALYALAATSALGALLGIWQLRNSLGRHCSTSDITQSWRFGKWLAGGEILNWGSSVHMYQYLAAISLDVAAGGVLKAAQIIFGPMRVLSFFIGNILPIRFARTLAVHGPRRMDRELKASALQVVPLMAIYCLAVSLFAPSILRLLYGESYVRGAGVLVMFSIASLIGYSSMFLLAALTARQLTRQIFIAYVCSAVNTIVLGWLLTHYFGMKGVVISMILSSVLVTIVFMRAYMQSRAKDVDADLPIAPLTIIAPTATPISVAEQSKEVAWAS